MAVTARWNTIQEKLHELGHYAQLLEPRLVHLTSTQYNYYRVYAILPSCSTQFLIDKDDEHTWGAIRPFYRIMPER